MSVRRLALQAILVAVFLQPVHAREPLPTGRPACRWVADARWYYIVVQRFQNGDKANDREGTIAWSPDWPNRQAGLPLAEGDQAPTYAQRKEWQLRRYGGDLQGIVQRLSYLKELGVNTLCLSPIFQGATEDHSQQPDLRHIEPSIAVTGSFSATNDEGSDPATWKWTASDRIFLDLLKKAHEAGFRVVIGGLFGAVSGPHASTDQMEGYVFAAVRRWMDPDGDGNPSDGVDGWISSFEDPAQGLAPAAEKGFWGRLADQIKKTNPNAVLIANGSFAVGRLSREPYDIAVDFHSAGEIQRFLHPNTRSPRAKVFFDALQALDPSCPAEARLANLNVLSVANGPRLLTYLSELRPLVAGAESVSPGPMPTDEAIDRWRLATIFQHFYRGAPVTYYGDEVGVYGGSSPYDAGPMWWDDLPDPQAKPPRFRGDFFALVQWLHTLREKYAPLRRGEFRPVWFDDERKLLAFARSLPGDEVILLMNYGSVKQKVSLPAGKPGQLVAVLSPQLKAPAKEGADASRPTPDAAKLKWLQVGGSRQFVDPQGTISLWVNPMSVRVVLVNDK